jgi:hypothetical protein
MRLGVLVLQSRGTAGAPALNRFGARCEFKLSSLSRSPFCQRACAPSSHRHANSPRLSPPNPPPPNPRSKCKEVKCKGIGFKDGYGAWLDRAGVCYDQSASVIVMVTDTCPCHYPGNYHSNKRWCCGDM